MSQRLTINYNKKPCYDIVYENNFNQLLKELSNFEIQNRKICVITDSNVSKLYSEKLNQLLKNQCIRCVTFTFEAGENQKTLDTVKEIYTFLIEEKFDRSDLLLALGGGVVGDITGFVAGTYLRGIDFIQIPTTLLAQADSSIGGKTGVDFNGYKNMVGAFKMPILVYVNIETLKTLEDRQFFAGFAEVMKSALLGDGILYEWLIEQMYEICEKQTDILEEMLIRTCKIKKRIVENDPFEKGDRALLNLGHTLGHGIEKAKGFELYHGECVALGCVAAAYISWKKEYLTMEEYYEIRDMFVPFYLPISIEDINPAEIVELTKLDKKMEKGQIRFILLKKIGKAFVDNTVTEEEMIQALEEIHYNDKEM